MNTPSSDPQRQLSFEELTNTMFYLNSYLHPLVRTVFPHLQFTPVGTNETDEFVFETTFKMSVANEEAEALAYEMTISQMCAVLRGTSTVTTECLGASHVEGFSLCRFKIGINIPRQEIIRD